MKLIRFSVFIVLILAPAMLPAESITLDGQGDMNDAYLDYNEQNLSRATETWIYVKCGLSTCTYPGVMKFDLSGISGTIDSVSLKLRRHAPDDDEQVYFYRITTGWVEETDGNPEVTYDSASTRCPSCAAWTTEGGDYNSTVIDSLTDKGSAAFDQDVYCQRGEGVGLAQLIQDWVDGTYANYGILIKSQIMGVADTLYFYSSENFNETSYPRPKLYIEYTPGGGMSSARRRKIIVGGQ